MTCAREIWPFVDHSLAARWEHRTGRITPPPHNPDYKTVGVAAGLVFALSVVSILWRFSPLSLSQFLCLQLASSSTHRVAGATIRLVASVCVCVCVCPSVCQWTLSCLNRLTFDLDFWLHGRPWSWLAWDCRSGRRSKVKVKQWKLFTLSRLNQRCGAGRY